MRQRNAWIDDAMLPLAQRQAIVNIETKPPENLRQLQRMQVEKDTRSAESMLLADHLVTFSHFDRWHVKKAVKTSQAHLRAWHRLPCRHGGIHVRDGMSFRKPQCPQLACYHAREPPDDAAAQG